MKQFLFLYRSENSSTPPSLEEMQANMARWMDWLGSVAAQGKLVDRGNRLHNDGKVVKQSTLITDGPYTEIKETLGGYSIINAESLEEAAQLASGCPIFLAGGNVEVREIFI